MAPGALDSPEPVAALPGTSRTYDRFGEGAGTYDRFGEGAGTYDRFAAPSQGPSTEPIRAQKTGGMCGQPGLNNNLNSGGGYSVGMT